MKIAIIGYGLEGHSSYEYWKDKGDITICDINNVTVEEGVQTQIGDNYLADISRFDLIVRSPIIKPADILEASNQNVKDKITSNTNEFLNVCPTKNIIGVTGTKGKGTTSTLIAKLITSLGKTVHLGGNIGKPALELLNENIQPQDWVVLELSSFQLIDIKKSPHIAVCLMVVAEHLDWHPEINDYFNAKTQLFRYQNSDDVAIYYANNENSKRIASTSKGWKIPYLDIPGAIIKNGYVEIANEQICSTSELGLLGEHNWQNVCAAVTVAWQIGQDTDKIRQVLKDFNGLEHRLELVKVIDGVSYYDDSFGTTPETAIVAIESFKQPIILIIGGSDKGASYDDLAMTIKKNAVKSVVLIGNQGPRIEESLTKINYADYQYGGDNMQSIVTTAQSLTKPGDVVLLSPACASFDMFNNYKDRGDKFKQAVLRLASND